MKLFKLIFGIPGIYHYCMFLWIIPFFIREIYDLYEYETDAPILYLNIYFVPLLISIGVGLLMNIAEHVFKYWEKANFGLKYFILNGIYVVSVVINSTILFFLDSHKLIKFFGDACGSIAMLFWPSVVIYGIVGIPFTLVFHYRSKKPVKSV